MKEQRDEIVTAASRIPLRDRPILSVTNLHTYFNADASTVKALDGISFDIHQGQTLGIVGASGSGKSVLAKSIFGLVREPGRVVDGAINFFGEDLLRVSRARLNNLRGREMSLIASDPKSRLNPLLSVGTQLINVIRAKQALGRRAADRLAVEMLRSVAIGDPVRVAHSLPHELSGGMCQRVIVAMALVNSPRLLVADEPTAGLDVTVQLQVLKLMMNLVNDTASALLLMTRDLGIIANYADRVAVLEAGHLIEQQEVRAFFANPQQEHSLKLLDSAFAAHGQATP